MNKKDFQKTIKAIRDEIGQGGQFPKAMMTGAQEMKNTATVNCGFDYSRDKGTVGWLVKQVFDHKEFKALLERNDAQAFIEFQGSWTKQIRIVWRDER